MRAVLLLLLLRHSLALVPPAAKPRATRLGALTDEVLDVAQWVGTNADQLPIGEYAPFAAAGAAAGAMAVSGAAVLRSFERDAPVESPLSKDGRYDPEAADAYFGRRPVQTLKRGAEIAGRAAGLGAAILLDVATDSVKEYIEPLLRSDFALLETFAPTRDLGKKLKCPVVACYVEIKV